MYRLPVLSKAKYINGLLLTCGMLQFYRRILMLAQNFGVCLRDCDIRIEEPAISSFVFLKIAVLLYVKA
jgi:hypothetical protein